MTIERKVGMGIAGQPTGPAPDVAEVFSIDLFTVGNQQKRIYNGIDLTGEGGMVWFASRADQKVPNITDTERGAGYRLRPFSNYNANGTAATSEVVTEFKGNGFIYGDAYSSSTAVAWTFRKKKKFFDVVTWTGNGVAGRTIAHDLGSVPAIIIKKRLDTTGDWQTYHKDAGGVNQGHLYRIQLNETSGAAASTTASNNTAPTSTVFTLGTSAHGNASGGTYVAYLFADNSSEDADNQMIKCGSYTGNGTFNGGPEINLGWEPQFVMIKCASATAGWYMYDSMRGIVTGSQDSYIYANADAGENTTTGMNLLPTGFQITGNNVGENGSGQTYIYMAIRTPMMKEPEAATDVFAVNSRGTTAATAAGVVYHSGFPVDFSLEKNVSQVTSISARNRLNGPLRLQTDNDSAETNEGGDKFSSMDGFDVRVLSANTGKFAWMWKRAKGYMDVVCYNGAASASTVPHSLGVVPEMIWTKYRNGAVNWAVYHSGIGNTKHLRLNDYHAQIGGTNFWNNTTPTDTHFTVGTDGETGHSSGIYIAYLFATLEGISKVGSYTGNGSSQTIDCGFSAGSRFILIKRTDATGSWYLWDSARGIVAGDEPNIFLDTTSDQNTTDSVDPHNSGFIVNQVSSAGSGQSVIYPNVSGGTYIFYAIA